MHPKLDAGRRASGNAQQFDTITQLLRITHIVTRQLADTLNMRFVKLHRNTKCQRRQNRQFVRSIDTLDIKRRIYLGITLFLRQLQGIRKTRPLIAHLGKDEIGRAIDNPGNPLNAVSRQPFAYRLDNRDTTTNRRLKSNRHALLLRRRENFRALFGNQCLIGGHHVFTCRNGRKNQFTRQGLAAHRLDHNIHIRIPYHRKRIVDNLHRCIGKLFPRARHIPHRRNDWQNIPPGATRNLRRIALQYRQRTAADGSQTQNSYPNRLHSCPLIFMFTQQRAIFDIVPKSG